MSFALIRSAWFNQSAILF